MNNKTTIGSVNSATYILLRRWGKLYTRMQNEVSWYFFIKKYQRDLVLLNQHNFLSSKLSLNTNYQKTEKQQQKKNTGKCTVTVLTGQLFHFWWGGGGGGGFLGEFSVANYFFQRLHSSWIFFWSIFLHQMFFFCLQHGEITTIHYYSIQFLQHSHISERFRVGVFFLGILFICRTITIITKRCQKKL